MSKGGVDRWACVSRWSVAIAFVMGLVLALGGYLNFVTETQANILNNFSTEHKAASVARGFLAVTMVSRGSLPVVAASAPFFDASHMLTVAATALRRMIPVGCSGGVICMTVRWLQRLLPNQYTRNA